MLHKFFASILQSHTYFQNTPLSNFFLLLTSIPQLLDWLQLWAIHYHSAMRVRVGFTKAMHPYCTNVANISLAVRGRDFPIFFLLDWHRSGMQGKMQVYSWFSKWDFLSLLYIVYTTFLFIPYWREGMRMCIWFLLLVTLVTELARDIDTSIMKCWRNSNIAQI